MLARQIYHLLLSIPGARGRLDGLQHQRKHGETSPFPRNARRAISHRLDIELHNTWIGALGSDHTPTLPRKASMSSAGFRRAFAAERWRSPAAGSGSDAGADAVSRQVQCVVRLGVLSRLIPSFDRFRSLPRPLEMELTKDIVDIITPFGLPDNQCKAGVCRAHVWIGVE